MTGQDRVRGRGEVVASMGASLPPGYKRQDIPGGLGMGPTQGPGGTLVTGLFWRTPLLSW